MGYVSAFLSVYSKGYFSQKVGVFARCGCHLLEHGLNFFNYFECFLIFYLLLLENFVKLQNLSLSAHTFSLSNHTPSLRNVAAFRNERKN